MSDNNVIATRTKRNIVAGLKDLENVAKDKVLKINGIKAKFGLIKIKNTQATWEGDLSLNKTKIIRSLT